MKDSLAAGLRLERQIPIDPARTISFMGDEGRVYATPELVRDIEMCSRDLLLEHLDAGEDSVGTAIAVEHTAPTPLGMTVTISVTITSVQGRAVQLEVAAADDREPVAKGTHARFIVDTAKTVQRVAAKKTAWKAAGSSSETAGA